MPVVPAAAGHCSSADLGGRNNLVRDNARLSSVSPDPKPIFEPGSAQPRPRTTSPIVASENRAQGAFATLLAKAAIGAILAVGLTAIVASPATTDLAPSIAAPDAQAFCATQAKINGYLSSTGVSGAAQKADSANTTVYGYITSHTTNWSCNAFIRYTGIEFNTTDTLATYDWGRLTSSITAPCQYGSYTESNPAIVHANTSGVTAASGTGACPTNFQYPLAVTLVANRTYQNDTQHNNIGDFSFVETSCTSDYGAEPIKTGTNAASPNSNSWPGASCDVPEIDGTGTSQVFKIDTAAPASVNTSPTTSTSRTVAIPWTATDGLTGVASATVFASAGTTPGTGEINCGATAVANLLSASGTTNCTVTADGVWGFRSAATDKVGNAEALPAAYETTTTIDSVGPGAPGTVNPTTTLYLTGTSGTVTWSAAGESGSGINRYEVNYRWATASSGSCINVGANSGWVSVGNVTSWTPSWGSNTCFAYQVRAVDNYGNLGTPSPFSAWIISDQTLPSASTTLSVGAATYTSVSSVTSTWSTSDAHAGVNNAAHYYRTAPISGNACNTAAATSWTALSSAISGNTSLAVDTGTCYQWATNVNDRAGNSYYQTSGAGGATPTQWVMVDRTNPTSSISAPAAGGPVSATSPYTVTFAATDAGTGFVGTGGWSLQRQIATYTGTCGTFDNDGAPGNRVPASGVSTTNATGQTNAQTLANGSCYKWVLTVTDAAGNSSSATSGSIFSGSVPTVAVTDNTSGLGDAFRAGNTIFFDSTDAGSVQLTATGSDPLSTISSNSYSALGGTPTGWSPTSLQTSATNPYAVTYSWTPGSASTSTSVTSRNASSVDSAPVVITFTPDGTAPTTSFAAPAAAGPAMQPGLSYTVTFTASDAGSGFTRTGAGWSLQRQVASATNGICGTFANDTAAGNRVPATGTSTTSATGQSSAQTLQTDSCYRWVLSATDSVGLTSSVTSGGVLVDTTAPGSGTGSVTIADDSASNPKVYRAGSTLWFRASTTGSTALAVTGADPESGPASVGFNALTGTTTGWSPTTSLGGQPNGTSRTYSWTTAAVGVPTLTGTATNGAGSTGSTALTLSPDAAAPALSAIVPAAGTTSQTATSVTVSWTETESGSGVASRSLIRKTAAATASTACDTATYTSAAAQDVTSPKTESGLSGNACYTWTITVTDRVGNVSTIGTTGYVFIADTAPPAPGTPDLDAASDAGPVMKLDGTTFGTPGVYTTDNVTNDATPSFSGSNAVIATSVDLFADGVLVGTDSSVSGGSWNITASSIDDGVHALTAKAVSSGGTSAASSPLSVSIDTDAPAAPSTPDLDSRTDSGASNTDNITDIRTPLHPNFTGDINTGHFTASQDWLSPTIVSTQALTPYITWTLFWENYSGRVSTGIQCNDGSNLYDDHTKSGLTHLKYWPAGATSCTVYSWIGGFGAGPYDVTGGTYSYHDGSLPNSFAFLGTGSADTKSVVLYDDTTIVGADGAPGAGTTYVASPAADMPVGSRTVTTRAYDLAGNPSPLSGGLPLEIVAYLPALLMDAPAKSVVGASTYITATAVDETGQPIDNLGGKVLTITTDDPGAVFPEGSTHTLIAAEKESGYTFRVLFSTPGTHTATVTATGVVGSTSTSINVAPEALRAAAPAAVYQGIPFKLMVMPRIADKMVGPLNKAYAARVTFSSSDTSATYGTEVDANKQYTFICNCDGAHMFATKLTATGFQTITVTDQFGATDTVTVNVLPAPSGGIDPISRIDVVHWKAGNAIDYYVTATSGYQLLYVQDSCGLSNSPIGESGDSTATTGGAIARLALGAVAVGGGAVVLGGSDIVLGTLIDDAPGASINQGILPSDVELTSKPYNQGTMTFKAENAGVCGPYGFGNYDGGWTFIYTDGQGHTFSKNASGPQGGGSWKNFTDVPGHDNFTQVGPDDPLISYEILSRGGTSSAYFTDPSTGQRVRYVPGGLVIRFTTNAPMEIYRVHYIFASAYAYDLGPAYNTYKLPAGTTTLYMNDVPYHNSCLQSWGLNAGRIFYRGTDGRHGLLVSTGLFPQSTYPNPGSPNGWGCDQTQGAPNPPDTHDSLADKLRKAGLDGLANLADAASGLSHATVGDPVDSWSGGQTANVTDISIGGATPFLSFTRNYRSDLAEAVVAGDTKSDIAFTLLGAGWYTNLDWRLVIRDDGKKIVAVSGNAGAADFVRRDNGTYGGPIHNQMELTEISGGYTLLRPAGDGYRFDSSGRLVAQLDDKGNELTLEYDIDGHLESFTDAAGRTATVTVNGAGHITRIDLEDGRHVDYTYDAKGFFSGVTSLGGREMTYVNDRRGRIVRIEDVDGRVLLRNVYDARGRVITQTDALGKASSFAYDRTALNISTVAIDPRGAVSITCFNNDGTEEARLSAIDGIREFAYDNDANLTSVIDEAGARTRYKYDANGNLVRTTNAIGQVMTSTFNAAGQPVSTADANGTTTATIVNGRPTAITRTKGTESLQAAAYTYTAAGHIETMTTSGGATTTLHYDGRGYIDYSIDGLGRKTTFVTDDRGLVVSSVGPLGNAPGGDPDLHTTTWTYDDDGHVLTITDPLGNAPGGDAAAHRTTNTYDSMGRLKTSARGSGALTTYGYDLAGQMTSVAVRLNPTVTAVTTHEYDSVGNRTAIIDPESRRTETTYDFGNRPITVESPAGLLDKTVYDVMGNVIRTIDAAGLTTRSTYDALNRVTSVTDTAGDTSTYAYDPQSGLLKTVTDALDQPTTYDYDWLGRQISVTNAKQQTSQVTYNDDGTIATAKNARQFTTEYTYNAIGQMLTVTEPGNAGDFLTTFTYDDAGRLETRQNHRGATDQYEYDALGRPTKLIDTAGKTWRTFYTNDGQVDHTIDGKGVTTSFDYDLAGRLLTTTPTAPTDPIAYTYDKTSRLLTMDDGNGTTVYDYDPDGRVASVERDGRTTSYTYDEAGRPETVDYPGALGTVTYDYDTAGRISTVTDWADRVTTYHYGTGSLVSSVDRPGGLTTTFGYDELNRPLTAVSTRASTTLLSQGWTYDANGNIATIADDTGLATFSYDNLDRILAASYPNAQDYAYTYDSVGNTLTATTPTGTATYTYDLADRITSFGPGTAPDEAAPTAPTAPAAAAVGSNRINVSWTASTDAVGVTKYTVSRGGTAVAVVDGNATSFSDFSVAPSTAYSYTVTASDAAGNTSAASGSVSATSGGTGDQTPPTAPTAPAAAAVGSNRINVSWTASTDAVGVTKYTVSRGGTAVAVVDGNATSFSDFSVAPSTAYGYTVTATDAAGNTSGASASAGATTGAATGGTPGTATNAPTTNDAGWTTPGNVYASDDTYASAAPAKNSTITMNVGTFGFDGAIPTDATITGVTVSVEWKVSVATSNPTLGSQLYAGGVAKGTEHTNVASPISDTTETYSVSGLTRADLLDGTLTVRIRASRGNSNTAVTASLDAVSVKVDYTTPAPPDATAPSVPTGLTASANGNNRIDLGWTASTDNVAVHGYKVFRDTVEVGTLPIGTTTFSDTGVGAGAHDYKVAAVDGAGNTSAQSSTASATATAAAGDTTAPSVPTGLAATTNGPARIDLSWTASTDNVALHGYKVFRDTVQVGTLPVGTTSFSDTAVAAGLHTYTVTAVDGANNDSAQSTSASATALTGTEGAAPTYDDNGNMLSDGTYGNRTYQYDTLGRLIKVGVDGVDTTYELDGAGNRWGQTTGATTTSFDLDLAGEHSTILYDGTNQFLPGAPGAGFESGGVWKNNLTDLIGSPIKWVDTAGNESVAIHYDPYGVPRPGSTVTPGIGYAGEYRDPTGLINLRARSYDPVLGRFIGRDTFGGVMSAPQTGNRYAYALTNPLRYTDPSGRFVNFAISNAPMILSLAVQATPVGWIYSTYCGITGYDPIAGVSLSPVERGLSMIPLAGKVAGLFASAARAAHGASAIDDAARFASRDARVGGNALSDASGAGRAGSHVPGLDNAVAGPGATALRRNQAGRAIDSNGRFIVDTERAASSSVAKVGSGARRGPKPEGEGPHNLKIQQVARSVTDGNVIHGGQMGLKEHMYLTEGGLLSGRRPDIVVERPDGSFYGINVGLQSKRTGAPIKREAEALHDLEWFGGVEMYFVAYN